MNIWTRRESLRVLLAGATMAAALSACTETEHMGHDFVDFGLSVRWATCNVGAETPTQRGDFVAWGETSPKELYDWDSYQLCRGSFDRLTHYNSDTCYGETDYLAQLDPNDDAATAQWGGHWRTPAMTEWSALRNRGCWIWTTDYNHSGVSGYMVFVPKADADHGAQTEDPTLLSAHYELKDPHIFLPATGYKYYDQYCDTVSGGFYWTNTLNLHSPSDAYSVDFHSSGAGRDYGRSAGRVVRAVYPKDDKDN